MSRYTQLGPKGATQIRTLMKLIDSLPADMLAGGITQKEASQIRTQMDLLAHMVMRHCEEWEEGDNE